MTELLIIAGMTAVTFASKALVFVLGERVRFPPLVRMALGFVPVTVQTAIIVPMTLMPHGRGVELSWHNPYLPAALVAITIAALTRRPLLTIAVSMAVFLAWQWASAG
jgi:branched-subunit amino acid transport protein